MPPWSQASKISSQRLWSVSILLFKKVICLSLDTLGVYVCAFFESARANHGCSRTYSAVIRLFGSFTSICTRRSLQSSETVSQTGCLNLSSQLTISSAVESRSLPAKGTPELMRAKSMTPRDQTSTLKSLGYFRTTSGAM